jgi:hypothetical protein
MPDVLPLSRCMVPDEAPPPRSDEGALCCAAEPADPASRPIPVPCAFAKPVPAISAAAATEIKKRLLIECLLTCFCIAHAINERSCLMFRHIAGSAGFVW